MEFSNKDLAKMIKASDLDLPLHASSPQLIAIVFAPLFTFKVLTGDTKLTP